MFNNFKELLVEGINEKTSLLNLTLKNCCSPSIVSDTFQCWKYPTYRIELLLTEIFKDQ